MLNAQIRVNAGKDRHFCITPKKGFYISPSSISLGLNDTLGDNPSVQGGISPYTYRWTTLNDVVDVNQKEIDASSFLNSILVPNPKLIKIPFKTKPFFLTVTDSLGNKSKDTIYISNTNFQLLVDKFTKTMNDTISVYQQFWTTNAQNFYWVKSDFSSDTINNPIKVWNTKNDSIKSWAIDYFGCISDTSFIEILINDKISIQQINNQDLILNFHNPINDNSTFRINDNRHMKELRIYNNIGQLISNPVVNDKLEIGKVIKAKGFFTVVFYDYNGNSTSIKIQKD